jgi:diadenosine tetraphosphate (Ap4A) HIT family hydrolase
LVGSVTSSCQFCDTPTEGVVFEDEAWLVRSISSTPAVAGWLILQARRHVPDPADLNAKEAATFGPTLQRFAHILREVTGAVRIYTASLNESTPHFHCHLLPRLCSMPNNAIGFQAFGLSELARRGEVRADPAEVQRILDAVRERAAAAATAGGLEPSG